MAKKNEEKQEGTEPIEEKKIEKKAKAYRVKTGLGFENGKRSFFEDGRNILLIEGETVSEEDYNIFNERAKELFFE
jgi:hypothetical protein